MLGKKSYETSAKNVFYMQTNIATKKWEEKNARYNFFTNTRIVQAKNGKKSSGKGGEKSFLYSHEYRDQKMEEKKRETIFPETHE